MEINDYMSFLSKLCQIPVCEYHEDGHIIQYYRYPYDSKELSKFYQKIIGEGFEYAKNNLIYKCILPGFPISLFVIFCSTTNTFFVFGPVCTDTMTTQQCKKYNDLCRVESFSNYIFSCNIQYLATELSFVLSYITGKNINEEDVLNEVRLTHPYFTEEKDKINYIITQIEEGLTNHSYIEEQILIDAIRTGNEDLIRKKLDHIMPAYPQVINNYMKNEEYMTVAWVAVICRAAMSGGVPSRDALLQSDLFLSRISKCNHIEEYSKIRKESILKFTRMVASQTFLASENVYVEDCKKYIRQNVLNRISLSKIAEHLCINSSYLARLFIEYEGKTVGDYIMQEKIHLAKNMLLYSEKSIAEISEYLSFKSQSYFSRVFKKNMQITPKEYRLRNHESTL